jgi:hypothetical protein
LNKLIFLLLLLLITPVIAGECVNNVCQVTDNVTVKITNQTGDNEIYLYNQYYFDSIPTTNLTLHYEFYKTMPYNIHFKYGLISITGLDYLPIYPEISPNNFYLRMVTRSNG